MSAPLGKLTPSVTLNAESGHIRIQKLGRIRRMRIVTALTHLCLNRSMHNLLSAEPCLVMASVTYTFGNDKLFSLRSMGVVAIQTHPGLNRRMNGICSEIPLVMTVVTNVIRKEQLIRFCSVRIMTR
jgi:hypothetical protein